MAGSYNHIVTKQGNLVSNEQFIQAIESLGDAYEMTEEMYGMIWFLAHRLKAHSSMSVQELVAEARNEYEGGLRLAEAANQGGIDGR